MIENLTRTVDGLLGKSVESPEVAAFLTSLGVAEKLKLDPDDGSAYVIRKNSGFTILFRDPAWIKNPAFASARSAPPILIHCFYYSEGNEGYHQFTGELPRELSFSDSRDQLLAKFGEPNFRREKAGRIVAERWDYDERSLHVTYRKDGQGILTVGYGIRGM